MILRLKQCNTCPGSVTPINLITKGQLLFLVPEINSPRRHTLLHHLSPICLTLDGTSKQYLYLCVSPLPALGAPSFAQHSCWGRFWESARRRTDKPSQHSIGLAGVQSRAPCTNHRFILLLLQLIVISKIGFLFIRQLFFSSSVSLLRALLL